MMFMDAEDVWRRPTRSADAGAPAWRGEPDAAAATVDRADEGVAKAPVADLQPARPDQLRRSDELLNLIESHGLTGAWSWIFDADQHAWSPGCFHLLGVDPRLMRPSYGLLLDLVHPDDRGDMARPSDLMRGETRSTQTFRIIRPDGTMRILCARNEIKLGPDGEPRSALGTLLDVTDRERGIRAQTSLRQQTRALSRKARILWFAMRPDLTFDFEPEAADLLGCAPESLGGNPFASAEAGARAALYRAIAQHQASRTEMYCDIVLHQPGGIPRPCRIVMIPPFDGSATAAWTGLVQIIDGLDPSRPDGDGDGRDAMLRGFHLRAARALLDWSMHDLAAASGLSLSTVRRLEGDDDAQPARSRPRALSALRGAGIRFMPLSDGTVAGVARPLTPRSLRTGARLGPATAPVGAGSTPRPEASGPAITPGTRRVPVTGGGCARPASGPPGRP